MRKLITALAMIGLMGSVGCGASDGASSALSGSQSTVAPSMASSTGAAVPSTPAGGSKADAVRMAAAGENFIYMMSRTDAKVDAAGAAVCAIKGEEFNAEAATAAYDKVIAAIPGAKEIGLVGDDSGTMYQILYDVYCPEK